MGRDLLASDEHWQVFYLAFSDQARNIFGGNLHDPRVSRYLDGLVHVSDLEFQVELFSLADHEGYGGSAIHSKTVLGGDDLVVSDGESGCIETSSFVGDERALPTCRRMVFVERL